VRKAAITSVGGKQKLTLKQRFTKTPCFLNFWPSPTWTSLPKPVILPGRVGANFVVVSVCRRGRGTKDLWGDFGCETQGSK